MQNKKTGTKRIKTERLVLRKILPTDYFAAVKWFSDPELAKFSMSRKPPAKWHIFKFICIKTKNILENPIIAGQ